MKLNTIKFDISKVLCYCQETGKVLWIKCRKSTEIGKEAGHKSKIGYITIRVNNKLIYAHRAAWFLYYGKWPNNYLDHIDGNKQNNKINNLKEVSHRQNNINQTKHRNGHIPGTTWEEDRKKWRASTQIKVNGRRKTVYLGRFETQEQAGEAYKRYHKRVGT